MDGVTNLPYRMIVQRVFDKYNQNPNQVLWIWTEFMNADGYMVQPHRLAHHFIHSDEESNLIVQIYGGTKETLVATAQDLDRKYGNHITGIELNIGCPSPRVMACGGGSALMRDYDYLRAIVEEISGSIHIPLSLKVRTWLCNEDKSEWFDTLVSLAPSVHMITIHGRTFSMGHSGGNDRNYIQRFKEVVGDQCLVIGNGGIKNYDEITQMDTMDEIETILSTWSTSPISSPSLDGYMIGQAAIGDPRIFTPHEPTPQDRYDIIMEHMHLLLAYEYRKEKNIPDTYDDPATAHNKQLLHARKKGGDIGDDTRHEVQAMQLHEFIQTMPTMAELDQIANNIGDYVNLQKEHQALAEFRKYLFNYIAGLPGSKELKKVLARTKEYRMMREEVEGFFSTLYI